MTAKEQMLGLAKDKQAAEMQLEKEKAGVRDLEGLVRTLNANRTKMEEDFARVNSEKTRLSSELQQYASARQQLAQARSHEIDLLSKAITNACSDANSVA